MARRRRETNAATAKGAAREARGGGTPEFLKPSEEPTSAESTSTGDVADVTESVAEPASSIPESASSGADDSSDDLRDRLASLQTMVEQLVAAQVTPEPSSGDPEVDSASRTLRFAQQTADSVIAEAREEALAIVADAERQRSEIIRRARQQADQDYAAERDEVVAASAAWQAQRDEVLEQLDALTTVFNRFQDGLADLGGTVDAVGAQLRTGVAAEPMVIASAVVGDEPAAGADDVSDAELVESDEADEPGDDPVVEAVGDVTNEADIVDLTRRNPFSPTAVNPSSVGKLQKIDADSDPFVFDVAELPETTGDFGWETDPTDGSDGATTF